MILSILIRLKKRVNKLYMNRLNLDIESYSIENLINLFSMKQNFTSSNVHAGKNKLSKQLLKAKDLSNEQKLNIQLFIDNASTILVDFIDKKDDSAMGTWAQKKNTLTTSGNGHFIIANPNTEAGKTSEIAGGRIAGTDAVPPGWLNPINIKTVTTCMNIDTRFRNLYKTTTSSDFQFDLPDVQKKVTHMRITNLDLPMSFYGVMRSRGDSTLVITESTKRNSSNMRTNNTNVEPMEIDSDDITYNRETGQWGQDFVQTVLKLHPCFSHIVHDSDIPTIYSLINISDPNNMTIYRNYGDSDWQCANFFKNTEFSFGWLVVLPDGNYECEWQKSNNAADLVYYMNNALANASPGILFHNSGLFLAYGIDDTIDEPSIDYGIDPSNDLSYTVDRASGKSIFNIPQEAESPSVFISGKNVTSDLNFTSGPLYYKLAGFHTYFAVNPGGSLALNENIQLKLGWQLGFRSGDYECDELTLCVSEGVAMVVGPRYLFLSIDEGLKNYCNDFIAAFSQHSMHENVMTKINIAFSMDNVGVYKASSDIGLDSQYNRTREYFGPGTITRLKIRLLDEYGRVVSLNNMDWSMSVVFEKLYD